jgi:hypothetical protein
MTYDDFVRSLRDYPGFLPGLVLAGAGGLLLGPPVGHRIGARRILASALIVSVGLIVAATLTPGADPPHAGAGCDLSRLGPAPLSEITSIGNVSLNILLFVPLGFVLGLLERSRIKAILILGAIALPVMIESIQLVVAPLDRACQSADVADNLTGLLFGLAAGSFGGWLAGRRASLG